MPPQTRWCLEKERVVRCKNEKKKAEKMENELVYNQNIHTSLEKWENDTQTNGLKQKSFAFSSLSTLILPVHQHIFFSVRAENEEWQMKCA